MTLRIMLCLNTVEEVFCHNFWQMVLSSTNICVTGWNVMREYIGESSRTFAERFKEHLKPPSPIYDHSNISGHSVTIDNFSIVGREDQNLKRAIKEALYIREK